MPSSPRIAHSHTQSMRLASGAEALVVRLVMDDGRHGFGFTFREDVAAARAMALWHATGAGERETLRADAPRDAHPWAAGWRAVLAGTRAAIDWDAEPGFAGLAWPAPPPSEK